MRARGGHFLVAYTEPLPFLRRLQDALDAGGGDVPTVGLFGDLTIDDTLGVDPHLNPRALKAGARRLSAELIRRGWVSRATGSLPDEDDRFVGNSWPSKGDPAWLPDANRDGEVKAYLGAVVDLEKGIGPSQIYGGAWPDGIVGRSVACALHLEGARQLEFKVASIRSAPELYPLELRVMRNGEELGHATLTAADASTFTFEVPESARGAAFHDIIITASNWRREPVRGISRLEAFRLIRVGLR